MFWWIKNLILEDLSEDEHIDKEIVDFLGESVNGMEVEDIWKL